jgi:ribokinase
MIVVFGSLNVDLVLVTTEHPRPGETVLCSASALSPGGKGNNQAVAAKRAGADVAMVGSVGHDVLGDFLIDRLRAEGIDGGRISRTREAMTGCASVAVDRRGENVIYVASGANALARADDVADELLARAATVVCQMEVPPAETFRLLARAKRGGVARTLLNLAPARDLDPAALTAIRDVVDILLVNRQEATQLATCLGLDLAPAETARVAEALARRLDVTCVLTLGAEGACAADRGAVWSVPALSVQVVDTTGAGDTFTGALAAALDAGMELAEGLRFASVAASLACRKLGAQESIPERDEIERRLSALARDGT